MAKREKEKTDASTVVEGLASIQAAQKRALELDVATIKRSVAATTEQIGEAKRMIDETAAK